MTKNKELALVAKYPKIFRDYGGPMNKTCMAWGFTHDDGWYEIVDELSEKLQQISDVSGFQIIAEQVKEKFGALKFYWRSEFYNLNKTLSFEVWHSIARDVTAHAEYLSKKTCEVTGKFGGKLYSLDGLLKTLIKEEAEKRGGMLYEDWRKEQEEKRKLKFEIAGF